jgi:RNA polymerase sigma factor
VGLRSHSDALGRARDLLARAQAGEMAARDTLIRDFTPFVLRVASQALGRYLRPGSDDEVSVALIAFNQAIDAYRDGRGSFLAFAETVIRRRLIDFHRRQRRGQEVPLSDLEAEDDEGHVEAPVLDQVARATWAMQQEEEDRRLEIREFDAVLADFGITFRDLAANCPKHRDARDRAMAVARLVASDPDLRTHLLKRRELPMKDLAERARESRKTLERHRRYIVAVSLILVRREEWPHLAQYVAAAGGVQ